jgi:NTE family protein
MVTLAEWLALGPFGLAMSSGFFAFYAHTGMATALFARGLLPSHVAGSSAGAMVAGAYGAGMDPDRHGRILVDLQRKDFWDPALGAGVLAGKKFDALLREMLPVARFEDCQVPVRISVFDILARRTRVLESGDLASAIRASCAVPVMFHPVWIDRRPYWDGGILDRPGIAGVPPGRLLYHHISTPGLSIPRRADMITLVLEGLPRANPFRLDAGRRALELARTATERALGRSIERNVVRVAV